MHHVFTLTESVSMATRAERQMERPNALSWERNSTDSTQAAQSQGKQPTATPMTPTQPITPTGRGANSNNIPRQLVAIPPSGLAKHVPDTTR